MKLRLINPLFYFESLKDLGKFILKPRQDTLDNLSVADKIASTIFLVFVTLLLSVSSHLAIYRFIAPNPSLSFTDFTTKYSPTYFFFLSIIIIPLAEEAYYRLPLKFNSAFISISSGIFFYHVISKSFFDASYYNFSSFFFSRLAFSAVGAIIVFLIVSRPVIKDFLHRMWTKYFGFIFYIVCFAFAWVHIDNFQRSSFNALLGPVVVLPQFILGLTTGYVRMQYGFVYAFLLHAGYNSSQYWLPF